MNDWTLTVQTLNRRFFIYYKSGTVFKYWKAHFATYGEAVGCMERLKADWRTDDDRLRCIAANFVDNRTDVMPPRYRSGN